jgi:ABC-type transport system involved in Fe-S cluster assembly fused permease/ATPase subunit
VLANGCIVEEGTHEQLMDRGAAYADLYSQKTADATAGADR